MAKEEETEPEEIIEENTNENLTDIQGEKFDKELHVIDEEGNPVLTKVGNLKRKSGKKTKYDDEYKRIDVSGKEQIVKKPKKPRATKAQIGNAVTSTLVAEDALLKTILGPDAALTKEDCEKLSPVLEACFKRYGVIDTPPWVLLLVVNGSIIKSKMGTDSGKENIKAVMTSKKGLWHKIKTIGRKKKDDKENDSETDSSDVEASEKEEERGGNTEQSQEEIKALA